MTSTKILQGTIFIFKTILLVGLVFLALIWFTPKAEAATITGTLISSYGDPAINAGGVIVVVDLPVQEYILRPYFGWEVEVQGEWTSTGNVLECTFFQTLATGPLYGVRNSSATGGSGESVITPPVVELTRLDIVDGLLSYNRFDEPVLINVLPEVYYGSHSTLRLPLAGIDTSRLAPYIEQMAQVAGTIWYSEYGVAMLTPYQITINGVEIPLG